jgi:hypothetical protein
LPDIDGGLGVGVAVGLRVGVGPLLVEVAVGAVVDVGVGVVRAVDVADASGLERTMGVQVDVTVLAPGELTTAGMINNCPARSRAWLVMPLASART